MSLNDKVVLITGGTGSFGNKFTEIVLREFSPKKLIVFSRDELKQYEMNQKYSDSVFKNERHDYTINYGELTGDSSPKHLSL